MVNLLFSVWLFVTLGDHSVGFCAAISLVARFQKRKRSDFCEGVSLMTHRVMTGQSGTKKVPCTRHYYLMENTKNHIELSRF